MFLIIILCRLIALTANTCAFMWTNCTSRDLQSRGNSLLIHPIWTPNTPQLLPLPHLFSIWPSTLLRWQKQKFALYFLRQRCVFLFMTTKETQSSWSPETLDANPPQVPHKHTPFLILWITKSVSFHMILPDLLLDHVSMCVCLPCVFVWDELENWECLYKSDCLFMWLFIWIKFTSYTLKLLSRLSLPLLILLVGCLNVEHTLQIHFHLCLQCTLYCIHVLITHERTHTYINTNIYVSFNASSHPLVCELRVNWLMRGPFTICIFTSMTK